MSNTNEFTATYSTIPSSLGGGYGTGIWTNFGPLTTTYTPPALCRTDPVNQGLIVFYVTPSSNSSTSSFDCRQGGDPGYVQNAACYPSSAKVQEFIEAPTAELAGGYWSPGVVCPSGWSTAYSATFSPESTYGSSRGWINAQHSMIGNHGMSATFVRCCPNGYTFNGVCISQVTTSTGGAMCDLNFQCTGSSGVVGSVCASDASVFRWEPDQTSTTIIVTAYPMDLMQQDSDLISTSSHTPGAPNTLFPSKSQSSSQGNGSGSQHHGSSSSVVKTIVPAVVVPVVALIAFIAAVILCLRHRKRKARAKAESSYGGSDERGTNVGSYPPTDSGDNAYSWNGGSPRPASQLPFQQPPMQQYYQ